MTYWPTAGSFMGKKHNSFKPQKANLSFWLRPAVISQSHSSSVMLGMGSWTKQRSGHTSDFCSRVPDPGSWSRRLIDGCSICGDASTVLALQERPEREGEAVDLLTDRRSSRAVAVTNWSRLRIRASSGGSGLRLQHPELQSIHDVCTDFCF